jgi:hypothetical protein
MMKRAAFLIPALFLLSRAAPAQDMITDVFSGKLINPETGVFAWYDLIDADTGRTYFLRQAIVGEEKVKRKTGWWVETEVMPEAGFPAVYKMLLTGPASDPENIHKLIVKEGQQPPRVVPVPEPEKGGKKKKKPARESLGTETIQLFQGEIQAEHVVLKEDGEKTELWLNNAVRPMGIVRMVTGDGELNLKRYGKGGEDARSAIPVPAAAPGAESGGEEEGPRTNFNAGGDGG